MTVNTLSFPLPSHHRPVKWSVMGARDVQLNLLAYRLMDGAVVIGVDGLKVVMQEALAVAGFGADLYEVLAAKVSPEEYDVFDAVGFVVKTSDGQEVDVHLHRTFPTGWGITVNGKYMTPGSPAWHLTEDFTVALSMTVVGVDDCPPLLAPATFVPPVAQDGSGDDARPIVPPTVAPPEEDLRTPEEIAAAELADAKARAEAAGFKVDE